MTIQQLIDEVGYAAAYDLDASGGLSTPRVLMYLDRAVDRLGSFNPKRGISTFTPLVGVQVYDLRGPQFSPPVDRVFSLSNSSGGKIIESSVLPPLSQTAGVPTMRRTDSRTLTLIPAPDAGNLAPLTVLGMILPRRPSMQLLGEECELAPELHLHAARWAASELATPNADQPSQLARITAMREQAEQEAIRLGRRELVTLGGAAPPYYPRFV